jgi:hypothetical protein
MAVTIKGGEVPAAFGLHSEHKGHIVCRGLDKVWCVRLKQTRSPFRSSVLPFPIARRTLFVMVSFPGTRAARATVAMAAYICPRSIVCSLQETMHTDRAPRWSVQAIMKFQSYPAPPVVMLPAPFLSLHSHYSAAE